jgi:MFS family permease
MRRLDLLYQVALASVFFGLGVGLVAFIPLGWPLVLTVVVFALAQAVFMPVSTTIVSHLGAVELRGRYMGVWTLVWTGGSAMGPLLGGLALAALGPSVACLVIIAAGLGGAGFYALLRLWMAPAVTSQPGPSLTPAQAASVPESPTGA